MPAEGVVRICLRHEDFRMSFAGVFQLLLILTLSISEVYFVLIGQPLFVLLVTVPAILGLLTLVASIAICWSFHFEVGPQGLDCFTLVSSEHINWSDVKTSRLIGFLGLEWLVIQTSSQKRALWLPLFVGRYALLRDLLVTFSDPRCRWEEKLPKAG